MNVRTDTLTLTLALILLRLHWACVHRPRPAKETPKQLRHRRPTLSTTMIRCTGAGRPSANRNRCGWSFRRASLGGRTPGHRVHPGGSGGGEPGTERTEIRIAYDDDAIYIGATLYDSSRSRRGSIGAIRGAAISTTSR